MAARGSKNAQQRTEAERARLHAARTDWHDGQIRRRTRDNTVAAIAGVVIVAAAIGSQVVHAQVTPPAPDPTSTVEPTDAPLPEEPIIPEPAPSDEVPVEPTPAG